MPSSAFPKYFFTAPVFCLLFLACANKPKTPASTDKKDSAITISKQNPYVKVDQSPMDMLYYPTDFPLQKLQRSNMLEQPYIRIIYSRPHKKGRKIFGSDTSSLCMYEHNWRLGANEATEIEFFNTVSIAGKNIAKGRYTMYCIPYPDKWTIVLNSNLFNWGLDMDSDKDILRTDIPVMQQDPLVEDFTMQFIDMDYGTDLLMSWDDAKTVLPIEFLK